MSDSGNGIGEEVRNALAGQRLLHKRRPIRFDLHPPKQPEAVWDGGLWDGSEWSVGLWVMVGVVHAIAMTLCSGHGKAVDGVGIPLGGKSSLRSVRALGVRKQCLVRSADLTDRSRLLWRLGRAVHVW